MLDISLSTGPAAFGSEFAQIRYSYNPHEVAAAGLIEEFQVFTFDTASGEWVPVDKVVDDIDNTQFNGFSSHFSAFVPAAAMAAPGTLAPPPSCIVDDFPAGIGGSAMADFFTVGESFTYYQDRTYTVVPTAASTQNAITFATFGFEGALGITICNGNSSCGPFSAHKHYAGDDYVNFIAHTDLDVYAMYDTRGGVNPVDTSEDAPWLAAAGFVDTGYFIETTDAVGLYTVYKNTYLQGQTVALHGNRKGVTDFAINTNYWVIMKEAGDASATPAEQLCVASPLNSPPTAVDDVFTIPKRNPNHDFSGLRCTHFLSPIDNDSDPDGDFPIVIAANGAGQLIPSSTGNATVQVGAVDGPWIVFYKPNLGFTGTDVFPYTISDQNGGTATGMITVNVINRPPVAMDDVFTIPERNPSCSGLGCTHFLSAIDNDSDPDGDFPIIIAANGPGQLIESSTGNATVKVAEADGPWVVFYTPDIGFTGTDVFPYTISDQNGGTDTATVTVNVTQAFTTSQ